MINRYEETQDFNFVTRFLHGNRYKNLLRFFERVQNGIQRTPIRTLDIGCGPARAFRVLDDHYEIEYCGIDPMQGFCDLAVARYGSRPNFRIACDRIENKYHLLNDADVVIGLESFEHMDKMVAVRVIESIAEANVPYFFCTVPNEVGPAILVKNVGSAMMGYSRHTEYSWKETCHAALYNLHSIPAHSGGHKGFDWRWLAETINQHMSVEMVTTSPTNFVPMCVSPSIGFMCSSKDRVR